MKTASHSFRRAQRGVSLLFALMALVVLALAGAAMVRSIDTGTLIMGNLGFKQDTLAATSAGTEEALTWLQTNITAAVINAESPGDGYYPYDLERLDPTAQKTTASNKLALVDWDLNNCASIASGTYDACTVVPKTGASVNGNEVKYIISRMCLQTGASGAGNPCTRPASNATSSASDRGELSSGGRISAVSASPYFRIVVRTKGARNTVSYTETLVHF